MTSDADLGLLVLAAEHAFSQQRTNLRPPFDPLYGPGWKVKGYITGIDTLFRWNRFKLAGDSVFYGWLLYNGRQYVAVIRGTGDPLEWWIDTLWMPRRAHPVTGTVESGFWSVYESMKIDGKPLSTTPDLTDGYLTIVGHSLGSALATYLTFDVAQELGANVRGIFIASPRPGDATFSRNFGKVAPNHVMYRNTRDIVPRVPFWFGYSAVPNVVRLSPRHRGIHIDGGLAAQHHVLTYFSLMQPTRLPWLHRQFGTQTSYLS